MVISDQFKLWWMSFGVKKFSSYNCCTYVRDNESREFYLDIIFRRFIYDLKSKDDNNDLSLNLILLEFGNDVSSNFDVKFEAKPYNGNSNFSVSIFKLMSKF
jgi:hypothetical protein